MRSRLLLAAVTLAVACARPTPYRPTSSWHGEYGYSDVDLGAGEYAVTVRANAATTTARVADMLLLRAADITLEAHHTHFVVLHRDTGDRRFQDTGTVPVVVAGVPVIVPVGTVVVHEVSGHLVVRFCDPGNPPPPDAIDAWVASRTLRAKLGLTKP